MVRLPDPERSRAVLVGAGAYADERIPDLPSAARNVAALSRLLDGVKCVTAANPPDVSSVLEPVRAAARQADDLLLVYFAGHGLLIGARRDLYLAVGDSDPDKPWTAVQYTQIADLVRDSPAAVKVVILDCCFSGRAIGVPLTPMGADEQVVEQVDVEGVYVVASSPATRHSYAPPNSEFTAFTGVLLEEIATSASSSVDGSLPLAQLFNRVRQRMRAAGLPEPQQYATNTAAALVLVPGTNPAAAALQMLPDGAAPAPPAQPQRAGQLDTPSVQTTAAAPARPATKPQQRIPAPMRCLRIIRITGRAWRRSPHLLRAEFSADGALLATAHTDKKVRLWSPNTGQQLHVITITGDGWWMALSPDGTTLAASGMLWSLSTGQQIHTLAGHTGPRFPGGTSTVLAMTFSADSTMVATTGHLDENVRLWDRNTGQQLHALPGNSPHSAWKETPVAFNPDGTLLATTADENVQLWNAHTGQPVQTLLPNNIPGQPRAFANVVEFNPDGRLLAVGSFDKSVRLWNPNTGQPLHTLTAHTGSVVAVKFSPDSSLLATASREDENVRLWNPNTGQPLHTLTSHTFGGHASSVMAFSPDGTVLATLSASDNTVQLWDPIKGQPLHTLAGHAGTVSSLAFSPDGALLATASDDMTVRIWG